MTIGLAPSLAGLLLDPGDPLRGLAPVWWAAGSDGGVDVTASDDDGDDDDDDADDDADDDDDGDGDASDSGGWTPPTRAEYERLRRRADTATREAAERKRLLRAAGLNPRSGRPARRDDSDDDGASGRVRRPAAAARRGDGDDDGGDDRRAGRSDRAALRAELEAETYRPALVDAAIELELTRAGVSDRQLARIARFIDREDLDVEYDPDRRRRVVVGVQEQIDELREEYPELFATPARRAGRRVAGARDDQGGRGDDRRVTRRGAEDVDGGSTRATRTSRAGGAAAGSRNRRASADDIPWNERVAGEFLRGGQ